ncbi:metallophosphoesterase [Rapidithrix thailandica]|uniref:Metallophosphoesterase n=1 Tax=Rapidithrix thailandica TaxID=413964 RepID=A0AAW9RWV1_9BACT
MERRLFYVLLFLMVLLLIDYYAFQAVRLVIQDFSTVFRNIITWSYWSVSALVLAGACLFFFLDAEFLGRNTRSYFMTGVLINLLPKLLIVIFLLLDDAVRLGKWVYAQLAPSNGAIGEGDAITRSEFLAKTGLVVGAVPAVGMVYGIVSGAHDYRIRKVKVPLANLPSAFHGFKIAQISDVHSGSFYNKTAVKGGVELLMKQKPDAVFFTGDLVNNRASEMKDYQDIFSKISAPLGVYSVLGNHDYGDYVSWASPEAQKQNLENLKKTHGRMGWNLLMNEHRFLEVDGEKIALLGIENWGAKGRFPKYGKLAQAYKGTEEAPVKLLLSHDPSHWDAQVRPEYSDIDIMFAGHTHGMQFGVEIPGLKWSPVQYMYEQWGGLYQKENQYLYVNRGYGYLGFPGRVGMLPEITIMELVKA